MTIPLNCKRLVEVDFPLVSVSEYAGKEKKIAVGSIAQIHNWWARRPLAACRAMNLACALPDPADINCEELHVGLIATELDKLDYHLQRNRISNNFIIEENSIGDLTKKRNKPHSLRKRLLQFIGEYSNWHRKNDSAYANCAINMVSEINKSSNVLLDSFAGGGSIPLEAQRIGLKPIATDINPIPIILNKLQLIELPQKEIEQTVENCKSIAREINERLAEKISKFYPKVIHDGIEETPLGYLCARMIVCEGIGCGVKFPLISSPWIGASNDGKFAYSFYEKDGIVRVNPIKSPPKDKLVKTCTGGNAKCPICGHITSVESVRRQLIARNGGSKDSQLMIVITKKKKGTGRFFRIPNDAQIAAREQAKKFLSEYLLSSGESTDVSESLPPKGSLGTRVQGYGMMKWGDLYSSRQILTSLILCEEVNKVGDPFHKTILALATSKFSDKNSSLSTWAVSKSFFNQTFKSHRLQMTWDYYEPFPFGQKGPNGPNFLNTVDGVCKGLVSAKTLNADNLGDVFYADATDHPLPDECIDFWAVDPPYYDSVPYSDLSNYFVVWLKRMFDDLVLENDISPKSCELVMDKSTIGEKIKNSEWYEENVIRSLTEGNRVISDHGIAYWVYAHKSTEGWATVLKGICKTGWMVTGSWPIVTERDGRMRSLDSASLSTSVHIVMRPRSKNAGVGDWSGVLNQLPVKLSEWLTRMKKSGIMGADAIYSCIGPAMELFSKFDSIERASGEEVGIDEYLQYVWDTVAFEAVKLLIPDSQHSTAEPDARFSIMAIWTLRQSMYVDYVSGESIDENKGEIATEPSKLSLPFDTASLLARGIGAVIEDLERKELVSIKGGTVKILSAEDRRQYLLGSGNNLPKDKPNSSNGIQMKLGESPEDAEARVFAENLQDAQIEMPTRESQMDKIHQAMLLHADGNSTALETHLRDNIGDDPVLWQLANTLNTLYPEGSWERSKVEGVIARYQSLR